MKHITLFFGKTVGSLERVIKQNVLVAFEQLNKSCINRRQKRLLSCNNYDGCLRFYVK